MNVKLVDWPKGLSLDVITDRICLATGGKTVDGVIEETQSKFRPLAKTDNPVFVIREGNKEDIKKLATVGIIVEEILK